MVTRTRVSAHERLLPPLWVLTLLAAVILLWLMYQLKEIMVLLVVGYCVAYLLDPLLARLERRGIARPYGMIVVGVGLVLIVAVLALTAVPTIATQIEQLSESLPSYITRLRQQLQPWLDEMSRALQKTGAADPGGSAFDLGSLVTHVDSATLKPFLAGLAGALLQGYSITLTLVNLFLLPFIVYYLAVDFRPLHRTLLHLLPRRQRLRIRSLVLEMDTYVSAFVLGQLTVGAILFALYAVGLGFVGIELWFLVAVIAGFGNFIPYFGFLCGIVLATLMAAITFGDFMHVLQVWAVFAVVQFLEGIVITPRIVGGKVGLSPLMVILAIFAGGKLFGLLGIFLAVPMAAVLKVLMRHLHEWIINEDSAEVASAPS